MSQTGDQATSLVRDHVVRIRQMFGGWVNCGGVDRGRTHGV
ncbi:hypothetical protein [uncultured Erythrobacter sp.]|nr:hypothetical protein [uncultured Erythrobacter sp.]